MRATKIVCAALALCAVFMAARASAGGGVNVSVPVPRISVPVPRISVPVPRISVPVPRISVPKVTLQSSVVPMVTVRSSVSVHKWGPRSVGPTGGSAFLQGTAPYYSGGALAGGPSNSGGALAGGPSNSGGASAGGPSNSGGASAGASSGGASAGGPSDSGGASERARYYAPTSYSGNATACGHYPYPRCGH
jgi:hypothetical protein